MTAGAHDAGGGIGRSAGTEAVKGLLVLAAVVIVGLFLMVRGLGDDATDDTAAATTATTAADAGAEGDDGTDGATADGSTDQAAEDDATITTLPPEDTATSLPPQRDPASVTVLAVNGSTGVGGIAGRATTIAQSANYVTVTPTNGPDAPSTVFFAEGYESDARAVAGLFNVDPDLVVKPLDPAAPPVDDLAGANIVIYLGADGVISA